LKWDTCLDSTRSKAYLILREKMGSSE